MKKGISLYLRNAGPVCYEAEVLPLNDKQALENWVTKLLSTGLIWCWESGRARPPANVAPYIILPEQRPLTLLNSMQKEALIADLSERDIDGYARFIAIFGLDKEAVISELDADWLKNALKEFIEQEAGAIHVAIVQVGDSEKENIFVRNNVVEPVRLLLESWGITRSTIDKTVPYNRLYLAKLESLCESVLTIAQG